MTKERLGIFGGTFNPPHLGHVHAACAASQALGMDILFVPDNIPPHKKMPENSPSAEERLEMVRLAALDVPGAQVLDLEIRREGRSYTADTVEALSALYPDKELWLIVGTDMLTTLHSWYMPERIFANAHIAALARNVGDREAIEESAQALRENFGAVIEFVDTQPFPVSSTQIREGLYSGAEKWLPARVFAYIKERGLYL
ncbi:MAG: nicotinate (nicotinamide) nucleotide adenylyltransferase [Oscillospiraceae bacterium]|nr:nicotinate (nicotinamide) nucleotide adenylyltransferase [Oscillospiraceae bacterium]MBQ3879275.1 nicotinate (nicotinamide) nucleotide adenylyltransferase [Oscillospiraceae bacterium]